MKRIAKLKIDTFKSDNYRAMLAKYGAPGALLVVRLQIFDAPDPADERQMLLWAAETGTTPTQLADMLATLEAWTGMDAQPERPDQNTNTQPVPPENPNNPNNITPTLQKPLRRKMARKTRRQTRQQLRRLKCDMQYALSTAPPKRKKDWLENQSFLC